MTGSRNCRPNRSTKSSSAVVKGTGGGASMNRYRGLLTEDTYCTLAGGDLVQVMSRRATKWRGIVEMLRAFGIAGGRRRLFRGRLRRSGAGGKMRARGRGRQRGRGGEGTGGRRGEEAATKTGPPGLSHPACYEIYRFTNRCPVWYNGENRELFERMLLWSSYWKPGRSSRSTPSKGK